MAKLRAALLCAALAVFGIPHWAVGQDLAPVEPNGADDALRLAELLDQVAVAYELDLSDSVFNSLQRLQSEQVKETEAIFETCSAEVKATWDLPQPVRQYHREALAKSLFADQRKAKVDFANGRFKLLSDSQRERLRQIDWQHRGVTAFSSSQVVKELALTAQQQKAIEKIASDSYTKFSNLVIGSQLLEAACVTSEDAEIVQLVKERRAQLEQVLTPEQLTKLAALRGKGFDLTRIGKGPSLKFIGVENKRLSLNLARLVTHAAVRDELKLSDAEHQALLTAWKQWDDVRMEQTADPAKIPSLAAIKNTAAGVLLRQQLARNLWARRYMQECETFQNEAGKLLNDEQVSRLQQIDWQREPGRMLLMNTAILPLSQEQFDSLSARLALHQNRLNMAAKELDPARKAQAIREAREKALTGTSLVLTVEQHQRFVALQGKPVSEVVLYLPLDHKSNWPQSR